VECIHVSPRLRELQNSIEKRFNALHSHSFQKTNLRGSSSWMQNYLTRLLGLLQQIRKIYRYQCPGRSEKLFSEKSLWIGVKNWSCYRYEALIPFIFLSVCVRHQESLLGPSAHHLMIWASHYLRLIIWGSAPSIYYLPALDDVLLDNELRLHSGCTSSIYFWSDQGLATCANSVTTPFFNFSFESATPTQSHKTHKCSTYRAKSYLESSGCRTRQPKTSGYKQRLTQMGTNEKCTLVRSWWYKSNKRGYTRSNMVVEKICLLN